uniref:Uncharacterized protein n=1 Tax=Panagrolaimus sp. ES5 TaxID=591445 RepID=A0AC34GP02_9BILA
MKALILSSLIFCLLISLQPSSAEETAEEAWKRLVPDGCKSDDVTIYSCQNTEGAEKKTCTFKKTSGITYSHAKEHGISLEKSQEESKTTGGDVGVNLGFMKGLFGGGIDSKFKDEVTKTSGTKEGWTESEAVTNSFTKGVETSEEVVTPPRSISHITSKIVICGPFKMYIGTPDVKTEMKESDKDKECDTEGDKTAHETEKTKYYECNYGKKVLKSCGPGTEYRQKFGCS